MFVYQAYCDELSQGKIGYFYPRKSFLKKHSLGCATEKA
jgi:hypothetical protein